MAMGWLHSGRIVEHAPHADPRLQTPRRVVRQGLRVSACGPLAHSNVGHGPVKRSEFTGPLDCRPANEDFCSGPFGQGATECQCVPLRNHKSCSGQLVFPEDTKSAVAIPSSSAWTNKMTTVGIEPTPLRNGALSHHLRPLGHTVAQAACACCVRSRFVRIWPCRALVGWLRFWVALPSRKWTRGLTEKVGACPKPLQFSELPPVKMTKLSYANAGFAERCSLHLWLWLWP